MCSTWEGTRVIFLAFFPALPLMLNVNLCGSMKSWGHVQQFNTCDSNPEIKTINWGDTYFRLIVFTSSFWHIRCTYAKKRAPNSYITLVQQVSTQAPLLRMSSIWGWSSLSSPQKPRSSLPPHSPRRHPSGKEIITAWGGIPVTQSPQSSGSCPLDSSFAVTLCWFTGRDTLVLHDAVKDKTAIKTS